MSEWKSSHIAHKLQQQREREAGAHIIQLHTAAKLEHIRDGTHIHQRKVSSPKELLFT